MKDSIFPPIFDLMEDVQEKFAKDLLELLHLTRALDASDSRDVVVTLLGIASDALSEAYLVDYSRTTAEIFFFQAEIVLLIHFRVRMPLEPAAFHVQSTIISTEMLTDGAAWVHVVGFVLCGFILISMAALPVQATKRSFLNVILLVGIMLLELGFIIPLAGQPEQCYNAITPNDMNTSTLCAFQAFYPYSILHKGLYGLWIMK
ncbi:hypothetical protein B0J12DRAFT_753396 [Macrophomina phaseolina]|uniref:G-protein coupled receptors family 3 profile domain-containing protein n=1 Tax=Macrophomina phaseolina TaxID=35725 RepID=A0ABQ8GAI2_9PEZI|nr:hypothetical protein B0J12DRAFT_753396 [Macrophomina phaseolina]